MADHADERDHPRVDIALQPKDSRVLERKACISARHGVPIVDQWPELFATGDLVARWNLHFWLRGCVFFSGKFVRQIHVAVGTVCEPRAIFNAALRAKHGREV